VFFDVKSLGLLGDNVNYEALHYPYQTLSSNFILAYWL
jgi:hypothetical protein